jgi:ABC transporter DrrB family efflux protein
MTAIASPLDHRTAKPTRPTEPAGLLTSTRTVARRAAVRYLRTPQLLVLGTVQMSGFMLVYRYVFGGAINAGGIPYADFLIPGFVTTGVLFTGIGTAVAMAEDLEQGFIDRLRSLPIPRSSVLAGRAIADTAILIWSLGVAVAIGFAVGFRPHGTALAGIAAFGLVVVFGYAFEWVFITLGLFARTPQAAQGFGLLVFPLTFASSAYVPVGSMPGWLQAFAQHQPLTYMVDAVRALTLGPAAEAHFGHPAGYFVDRALLWALAIIAVSLPLAVARYRRN